MSATLNLGQNVIWHKVNSNYGHISYVQAKVLKIGAKRVTIEVMRLNGITRKVSVHPERLSIGDIRDCPSSAPVGPASA